MPWRPERPGDFPTLGPLVAQWMAEYLAQPNRSGDYEPFIPYLEQQEFLDEFYRLDPITGRRVIRRGVLQRSRGWGKSPFVAGIACAEALGPVVPDGWDANGQPVGAPWYLQRTVHCRVAAVSEDQTRNTWTPLLEMLRDGPACDEYPGLEPMDTFVSLPGGGTIRQATSSARTIKGEVPVFAVMDQTEEWVSSNGGHKLAQVMRMNAAKLGGTTLETPNAFRPGEDSVAERSAKAHEQIVAGTSKGTGILYDHREAPASTDLEDRESLVLGLRWAYGDSSGHPDGCLLHRKPCPPGHVDIDNLVATIWDPDTDPQDARIDLLNQITHASDAFMAAYEWEAVKAPLDLAPPVDGELVVLGFDGSRGRAKGKPDATALIGCRVEDGHIFRILIEEAPNRSDEWATWSPRIPLIEAAIDGIFQRFRVAAFYCDPAKDWRSHVNAWEAKYAPRLVKGANGQQVKANVQHPFEWWMTGGRAGLIQRAIEQFEGAVRNGDLTHDGSADLTGHMLNARRRIRHQKLAIAKEHDYSERKVDGAIAAILAWQARLDAIAAGVPVQNGAQGGFVPRRIR